MNKLFVDAVNTPINKIIERIKLRPTTYMTIKTVKKGNLLLLVRYSSHVCIRMVRQPQTLLFKFLASAICHTWLLYLTSKNNNNIYIYIYIYIYINNNIYI